MRTLYKAVLFLVTIVSLISRYFGETEIKATLDDMPLQGAVVVGQTISTATKYSAVPHQPVQVDEVAIEPAVRVETVYNIEATIEGKPMIGADIEVDGEIVGKTPLKRLISEGNHVIYIYPTVQSNAVEQYMEFTLNPGNIGGEEKLIANFTVQSVIVNITAVINGQALKGAGVEIDGVMVGMAPISKKLGPGPHTVNIYPPANVNTREAQNMFRVPPGSGQVENLTAQFTSL